MEVHTAVNLFLRKLNECPSKVLEDEDVHEYLEFLRLKSQKLKMNYKPNPLIDLADNDLFLKFFLECIEMLSRTEEMDYLSNPVNMVVANLIKLQMILWNVSDESYDVCCRLHSTLIPSAIFTMLCKPHLQGENFIKKNCRLIVHTSVGILCNLLLHIPAGKRVYRGHPAVDVLISLANNIDSNSAIRDSDILSCRTSCLLLATLLVNKDKQLHVAGEIMEYILNALSDALTTSTLVSPTYGFHAIELLKCLLILANSSVNKEKLISADVLISIEKMLNVAVDLKEAQCDVSYHTETDTLATMALELLYKFAFLPTLHCYLSSGTSFRRLLEEFLRPTWPWKCCRVTRSILQMTVETLSNDLCIQPIKQPMRMQNKPATKRHLMISYSHSTLFLIRPVYEELVRRNYSVWIDEENIYSGSFVDHLASAVQNASGIIVGVCREFRLSVHCRQEVCYASQLGLPFFVLELEPGIVPSEWLLLLPARATWIPLYDAEAIDEAVDQLAEQIRETLRLEITVTDEGLSDPVFQSTLAKNSHAHDEAAIRCRANAVCEGPSALFDPVSVNMVMAWKPEDVTAWLTRQGLTDFVDHFLAMDGRMLVELARFYICAPESLSTNLQVDFAVQPVSELHLYSALVALFQIRSDVLSIS